MVRVVGILWVGALLGAGCAGRAPPVPARPTPSEALWGAEAVGQIRSAFYLPEQRLYGEEIGPGRGRPKPAFLWPSSVMLSALAAAARVERQTYLPMLREYVDALRTYRTQRNGITGFDVWPAPKPSDRYYDDNTWIALALAETYAATHEERDLELADEALRFALSGEDARLGGGIYWHEDRHDRKHTVSTAPAACAALELFRATGNPSYLTTGERLYAWTAEHLLDSDGLYADSIAVADGTIDHAKYAYNSAMMIRCACLLHAATAEARYLSQAQATARAAEKYWVRPSDGAIRAESAMAGRLCEAFLVLREEDGNPHSASIAARAVECLHDRCRDPNGWYANRWDATDVAALDPIPLIDQAAAARAFWDMAR